MESDDTGAPRSRLSKSLLRFGLVRVHGRSMQPTVRDRDVLMVSYGRRPTPGRLVIVQLPGGRATAVKRALRRDSDGWWVERDNPAEGVDSWSVGAIADQDVIAAVLVRIWPLRIYPTL